MGRNILYSFLMTKLDGTQLNRLRVILRADYGRTYEDEELASTGLAIVRFVVCKERHIILNNLKKDQRYDSREESYQTST